MPFKDVARQRTIVETYEVSVLEFEDSGEMYWSNSANMENARIEIRPSDKGEVPDEQVGRAYTLELDVWDADINDDRRIQVRAHFSNDDLLMFAQELASYCRMEKISDDIKAEVAADKAV